VTTDIVSLEKFTLFLYHIDTLGMVIYIQPVTHIFTITVYRQFLALQGIVDDKRDQLLRELVRSIVVGAVGDICRELISIHISLYQHVRRCLTCRVWAVWIIWCCLIEIRIWIIVQRTIYFICRYMQKLLAFLESTIREFPCYLCTVQHNGCTKDIGLNKDFRILDGTIYMRLCCKMNHTVNIIFCKDLADGFLIADICLDKGIILSVLDIFQIFKISCVCQLVHVDNTDLIVIFAEHIMNIIASNKSCSTCY